MLRELFQRREDISADGTGEALSFARDVLLLACLCVGYYFLVWLAGEPIPGASYVTIVVATIHEGHSPVYLI